MAGPAAAPGTAGRMVTVQARLRTPTPLRVRSPLRGSSPPTAHSRVKEVPRLAAHFPVLARSLARVVSPDLAEPDPADLRRRPVSWQALAYRAAAMASAAIHGAAACPASSATR